MPVPALGYGWFLPPNIPQSRINEVRKTMMTNPTSLEWITPACGTTRCSQAASANAAHGLANPSYSSCA